MHTGLHARYPIVMSNFNQNWYVPTNFDKVSKHYHENHFNSSWDVKIDGQSDFSILTDGQSGINMQSIGLALHLKKIK